MLRTGRGQRAKPTVSVDALIIVISIRLLGSRCCCCFAFLRTEKKNRQKWRRKSFIFPSIHPPHLSISRLASLERRFHNNTVYLRHPFSRIRTEKSPHFCFILRFARAQRKLREKLFFLVYKRIFLPFFFSWLPFRRQNFIVFAANWVALYFFFTLKHRLSHYIGLGKGKQQHFSLQSHARAEGFFRQESPHDKPHRRAGFLSRAKKR